MASVSKRHRSRRRLAALAFLSNISLDGSHRDTNLSIFNSPPHSANGTSKEKEVISKRNLVIDEHMSHSEPITPALQFQSNQEAPFDTSESHSSGHFIKEKEKVLTFVSDARTKLSSLSQRRKQLTHQHSFNEQVQSSTGSSENLVLGLRHRKSSITHSDSSGLSVVGELHYLKTPKERQHIKDERVVLVSSKKAPIVVYSALPYVRRSSLRGESKTDLAKRRHVSGARPLQTISDGPDPLDLMGMMGLTRCEDGQDVSYSRFLSPNPDFLHRRWRTIDTEMLNAAHHHPHVSRHFSHDVTVVAPSEAADRATDWNDIQGACHYPYHSCTSGLTYTPSLLDDPELIAGKHSTLLFFPSYMTSVINYVKPSDLKKELNDKFRERFPHVELTLSKLRSIKREMWKVAKQECGADFLTIAQAYVYYEKLILKLLINKHNRKVLAGVCLMLAAKLNDIKGIDMKNLLEKIECVFRVSRKDLLQSEFGVLIALEFSLHVPTWEIFPHFQRLLYES